MTASINFMPARQSRLSGIAAALLLNLLAIWLLLSAHQNMPLATRSRSVIVELLPLPQSRTPEAPAAPARKAPRPSTSVAVRHAAQPSVTPQPAKQPAPGAMTQPDIVLDAPVTRAPALNLDGLRDSVRNSLRQSQAKASEVRDLSAPKAEKQSPLAREMSKAQRGSCASAHANMGLLAPLAILKDTVTDTGCTWTP